MAIKTATITWITWHNYGSFLQAYALQKVIESLGYENTIINDELIVHSRHFSNNNDSTQSLPFYKRIYLVFRRKLHQLSQREREIRKIKHRFVLFKNSFLTIDSSFQGIEELAERYDVYIAGSDQIWVPNDEIFNPFYYLDFTRRKKISYAVSLNTEEEYPERLIEVVSALLGRFSNISVREESGRSLLEGIVNKQISVCLDPTLLLTKDDWEVVARKQRPIKRPYVLCYFLSYNEKYLQFAHRYADNQHLPLLFIANKGEYRDVADIMYAAGPSEFVGAVRDASFIITDSFHGTIFSILYEKDFLSMKRFKGNSGSNQNERLLHLFRITGITGRFADEDNIESFPPLSPINYQDVKERLNSRRIDSLDYLKSALYEGES